MRLATIQPIQIANFLSFFEAVMRSLPNKVIAISPFTGGTIGGSTEDLGDIVNGDILLGAEALSLFDITTLGSSDEADLFTTPVSGVNAITITAVGTRWDMSSTAYTPNNFAENISGVSTRQTLRGIGELISGIVAGDGSGLSNITALVLDQLEERAVLVENPTLSGTDSTLNRLATIDEIPTGGQGFGEAA